METRWLYTTSGDLPKLREISKDTCIIPMGCVEKHGLHMPLGTDIIEASAIAYAASQIEPVCVFPDFIFGDVPEGTPNMHPGTVTLPVQTELLLLEQLCEQIARNGFRKILVVNSHGGNKPLLNTFVRMLENKKHDFVFGYTHHPHPVPHRMAEKILAEGSGCIPELTKEDEELLIKYHNAEMKIGHACMNECAYIMGVAPESVHLEYLGVEDGHSRHKCDYLAEAKINVHAWPYDHPNAFGGDDPVGCNERIGKAAIRWAAEEIAARIKVFKDDENLWNWRQEFNKGW